MNFYTNDARTSNGFHVSVEQIECNMDKENPPRMPEKMKDEMKPEAPISSPKQPKPSPLEEDHDTKAEVLKKPSSKEAEVALNQLKYDDEPHEPMEPHPSTRAPPPPEMPKKQPNEITGVVYASKKAEIVQKTEPDFPTKGGSGRGMAIEMPRKPMEQHKMKIPFSTGSETKGGSMKSPMNYGRVEPSEMTPRKPYMKPDMGVGGEHRTICNERVIDKMYFELKSSDLKRDNAMGHASACQLNIKKHRPNICQLDVMFVRYNLADSSCGQQYVSIDGERVCGRVPENGVKKFWFIRSDMLIFAKLSPALTFGSEEKFHLKIRQVECTEQQQQQQKQQNFDTGSETKGGRGSYKDHQQLPMPGYGQIKQYEQKKYEDYPNLPTKKDEPMKKPEVLENMNTEDPELRTGGYDSYCDLIATDDEYKIVSPRRAGPHRCRYTIRKISNKICAVDIRFSKFKLEDGPDGVCDREHVEIDSGKICGTFPTNHERRYYFLPNEMEKMIYFLSNRSTSVPGDFVLNVKQIEDCSKPLVSSKFFL